MAEGSPAIADASPRPRIDDSLVISFDDIRREVALRHNVLLGVDDPILVTVTINELVLARYLDLAAVRATVASRELTVALEGQVAQAKDTAGRLITDAAGYAAGEVRQALDTGLREAVATAVRAALEDAEQTLQRRLAEAHTLVRDASASSRAVMAARNGILVAALVASFAAVIALVGLLAVVVKLG